MRALKTSIKGMHQGCLKYERYISMLSSSDLLSRVNLSLCTSQKLLKARNAIDQHVMQFLNQRASVEGLIALYF